MSTIRSQASKVNASYVGDIKSLAEEEIMEDKDYPLNNGVRAVFVTAKIERFHPALRFRRMCCAC